MKKAITFTVCVLMMMGAALAARAEERPAQTNGGGTWVSPSAPGHDDHFRFAPSYDRRVLREIRSNEQKIERLERKIREYERKSRYTGDYRRYSAKIRRLSREIDRLEWKNRSLKRHLRH